jgi:Zn-dependent peptidase ImmA (M78 family)
MKSSGDLLKLVPGLTLTDVHNLRRLNILQQERRIRGRCFFSEKRAVLLQSAYASWKSGMKPSSAFKDAETAFEQFRADLFDRAFEYREAHQGFYPTVRQLQSLLPKTLIPIERYVSALEEEREIRIDKSGRVVPLSVFRPAGLLASTHLTKPAHRLLDDKRKAVLRDLALKLYIAEVSDLSLAERIPVPTTPIVREGIQIEYRVLAPGVFGLSDPGAKVIFLSQELRKYPKKQRLVLLHEFFHIMLGHKGECALGSNSTIEAEATYAAVHYLVPVHTVDISLRELGAHVPITPDEIRLMSDRYVVSQQAIMQMLEELRGNTVTDVTADANPGLALPQRN